MLEHGHLGKQKQQLNKMAVTTFLYKLHQGGWNTIISGTPQKQSVLSTDWPPLSQD